MTLTNKNDMYVFFELIEQIDPKRILDVGMFLKRIGAVSRRLFEKNIGEEVCLEGIDLFPEKDFPIYETIYNRIWKLDEVIANEPAADYDLAFLLHTDQWLKDKDALMNWIKKHVKYCVVADNSILEYQKYGRVLDVKLDQDLYGIIFMNEDKV